MAKKKTKDTKGLAGIVNKVPREIDINGQLHMLAWITPKEGRTLKDLGGAGQPGPMGIPAYFDFGEDDGPDRGNTNDGPSVGVGEDGPDRGNTNDGPSVGVGEDGPDRGTTSYDANTGIDAETDDPDTAGAGSRVTGYQGPDSPGGERMGTPGGRLKDYYGGSGIDGDNRNTTKEEFGASIIRNNQLLGGSTGTRNTTWFTDIGSAGQKKARGAVKGLIDAEIERRRENAKSGYGLKDTPLAGIGSIFGAMGEFNLNNISKALENPESIPAFDAQGKIQGAYTPGLFGMVYTGNPIEGFEETGWTPLDTQGGYDDTKRKRTTVVSVTDAKVSAVPTSNPSYYGQGVGTATTNLYDPTKIDPYLASLYGITPSPIGATYDAATSSYSMPGSKKNAKSRTRLRGLDIFKPVSTV
jgi:hypothetical protein